MNLLPRPRDANVVVGDHPRPFQEMLLRCFIVAVAVIPLLQQLVELDRAKLHKLPEDVPRIGHPLNYPTCATAHSISHKVKCWCRIPEQVLLGEFAQTN